MDHCELGRRGEAIAARYLEARGWIILERNVRWHRKEVDLIATRGWVLAFIEVKTRRGGECGHPLEAITPTKRRDIEGVAEAWVRSRPLARGTLLRFDAISVYSSERGEAEVCHVPDAWRPEWRRNP